MTSTNSEATDQSLDDKRYEVTVRAVSGAPVVAVCGELDITSEADLSTALAEARARGARVVIDLRDARFIDASTIGVLFGEYQDGTALEVRGAKGLPRRVLEIVQASDWMDVKD